MDDEEWRSVVGFEGLYEVSSFGQVRGHNGLKKLQANAKGYLHVNLSAKGKKAFPQVHTLVAAAFIGPRPFKHDVAHWNGDPQDNRLANLRYCTRTENMADMRRHGTLRRGTTVPNAKLNDDIVRQIKAAEGFQSDIASRFGVRQQAVSDIKTGKKWAHVDEPVRVISSDPTKVRRRGEQAHNVKVTAELVREIRAATGTLKQIAERFGTSWQNVDTIRRRKTWKHID